MHLVTGASSGIGRALALELLAAGCDVIVAGRNVAAMEALRAETSAAAAQRLRVHDLDVSSPASVERLAAKLARDCVRLRALVNNAGVSMTREQRAEDGAEQTWAVNVRGTFLMTRTLLRAGVFVPGAQVLNVASRLHADKLSHEHARGTAVFSIRDSYLQSKLCTILLARGQSAEAAAAGVRINAAHPGIVRSNLGNDSWFARIVGRTAGLLLPPATKGARCLVEVMRAVDASGCSGMYFEEALEKSLTYAGDLNADAAWLVEALSTPMVRAHQARARAGTADVA